jgi:hypothetical protein
VDEEMRKELVHDALALNGLSKKGSGIRVDDLMGWIVSAKQNNRSIKRFTGTTSARRTGWPSFVQCYETYEQSIARSAPCRF